MSQLINSLLALGLTMKPAFTKYQLADQMRNYMHIDDKYLEGLCVYNMTHTSGKKFSLNLHDGQILKNNPNADVVLDEVFNVIYHNCSPYHAKRAVELRLSFRAAKDEYDLEPIVLVEIVIPFGQMDTQP